MRLLARASVEDMRKITDLQPEGASADDPTPLMRMNGEIQISDRLPLIEAPALAIDGRQDESMPTLRVRVGKPHSPPG